MGEHGSRVNILGILSFLDVDGAVLKRDVGN
jgi:hypothetical protein